MLPEIMHSRLAPKNPQQLKEFIFLLTSVVWTFKILFCFRNVFNLRNERKVFNQLTKSVFSSLFNSFYLGVSYAKKVLTTNHTWLQRLSGEAQCDDWWTLSLTEAVIAAYGGSRALVYSAGCAHCSCYVNLCNSTYFAHQGLCVSSFHFSIFRGIRMTSPRLPLIVTFWGSVVFPQHPLCLHSSSIAYLFTINKRSI